MLNIILIIKIHVDIAIAQLLVAVSPLVHIVVDVMIRIGVLITTVVAIMIVVIQLFVLIINAHGFMEWIVKC
jgi:hypothetical protein